ncbi:MAG TPA: DUF892 family protein [Anaerolineae bacterium]|jgi:ferritin-like metal-binding protein YciE|nr:DUF892 family protein [Anaerolineae bacterium]
MRSKEEMFLYFLNDMYSIETATLSLTKDLANKARGPAKRRDLEEHVKKTKHQMVRLKAIIHHRGGSVAIAKATAFSFLSIGLNTFQWAQTDRTQEELRMIYDALRIENVEIGSYKALIAMAKSLNDEWATSELQKSLDEEIAMSGRTEKQLSDALEQAA